MTGMIGKQVAYSRNLNKFQSVVWQIKCFDILEAISYSN